MKHEDGWQDGQEGKRAMRKKPRRYDSRLFVEHYRLMSWWEDLWARQESDHKRRVES